MAGAWDLPPFSFWAASISCLLISASSMAFFLASASKAFFSASAFLIRSSYSFFFLANSFSCSALISFLLDCFSFSLLSSSSSLGLSSLHCVMYSLSCSFNSFFCIPAFLFANASSPLAEVWEVFDIVSHDCGWMLHSYLQPSEQLIVYSH